MVKVKIEIDTERLIINENVEILSNPKGNLKVEFDAEEDVLDDLKEIIMESYIFKAPNEISPIKRQKLKKELELFKQ